MRLGLNASMESLDSVDMSPSILVQTPRSRQLVRSSFGVHHWRRLSVPAAVSELCDRGESQAQVAKPRAGCTSSIVKTPWRHPPSDQSPLLGKRTTRRGKAGMIGFPFPACNCSGPRPHHPVLKSEMLAKQRSVVNQSTDENMDIKSSTNDESHLVLGTDGSPRGRGEGTGRLRHASVRRMRPNTVPMQLEAFQGGGSATLMQSLESSFSHLRAVTRRGSAHPNARLGVELFASPRGVIALTKCDAVVAVRSSDVGGVALP